jgi:hypothetical protein
MPVACAATSPDPVVETVSVSQRTRAASTSLVTALARAVQAVGRQPHLSTSINCADGGAGLLSCCCGALDASAAAGLDRLSPVSSRLAADFLSFGRSYPMAARRSWKTSRSML